MYTIADYRKYYDDCKRSLELTKEIVKEEAFKDILPSPSVKKLRQSLNHLFSNPELSGVCRDCGGDCCITRNFCLTPFELFCFVIDNPKFVFPEPDWQFLESELKQNERIINNRCLFLSSRGCLLGEYRPIICLLFHDCDFSFKPDSLKAKIEEILTSGEKYEIFSAKVSRYAFARENFCRQVLKAMQTPEGSLSAFEAKGVLTHGVVGHTACLDALENLLLRLHKNTSRS